MLISHHPSTERPQSAISSGCAAAARSLTHTLLVLAGCVQERRRRRAPDAVQRERAHAVREQVPVRALSAPVPPAPAPVPPAALPLPHRSRAHAATTDSATDVAAALVRGAARAPARRADARARRLRALRRARPTPDRAAPACVPPTFAPRSASLLVHIA